MKYLSKTAAGLSFIMFGLGAYADNPTPDGLPMVAGDVSIANDVIHGNAHLLVIGDSIATDIAPSYLKRWNVDRWSGLVIGPNFPIGQYNLSYSGVSSETLRSPLTPVGPAGLTTSVPGAQVEVKFNGSPAAATDPDPVALASRFYELGLNPAEAGPAAQFANSSTGNLTLTPLIYANPNGVADNKVSMSVRINSTATPVAVLPLNGNIAATPTLVGSSVTIPAQQWNPGNYLTADFRVQAGAAPAVDSNLTIAGLRISNGGPGFQLANIALGGWNVENFLNNTITPQANVNQFVSLTDSNVTMIALGTNDLGPDDSVTFKANLQALMDRYRAGNPAMKFILMTTYDLNQTTARDSDGTLRQVAFNRDMYELSQADQGVLFLNLFDKAPDWKTLNSSYLADGVHPTAAGEDYFANLQWNLLTQAATPEPTTLGLTAAAAALLTRRRRSGDPIKEIVD